MLVTDIQVKTEIVLFFSNIWFVFVLCVNTLGAPCLKVCLLELVCVFFF